MTGFRIRGPKRKDSSSREFISIKYSDAFGKEKAASVDYIQLQQLLKQPTTYDFKLFHSGEWFPLMYGVHTLYEEFEILIGSCYTGREREEPAIND